MPSDILSAGGLELNLSNHTVEKNGKIVQLTPMEYRILLKLMKSPGRIFTKVQLYESVCGDYFEGDNNTIMVHISKLREKIEDATQLVMSLIRIFALSIRRKL